MTNGQMVKRTRVDEAEDLLRSLISEWRRNGRTRLPTEKELSDQLGVSRTTLRGALARLDADGEIARKRRVGTVIVSRTARWRDRIGALAYPVDVILSLSEYLIEVGVPYDVRSVTVHRSPADGKTAALLGIAEGSPVFIASRLYEVEGTPAAFLEHILPTVLGDHEVHIESLTEGITTFLRDSEHVRVTRSESTITAEAASGELATELAVTEGTPLLIMAAELFAGGADPVAMVRLIFRPDILRLSASAGEGSPMESGSGFGVQPLVDSRERPVDGAEGR